MIERAVVNVLDNAVKWSPPAGIVLVEVAGQQITVTDNGSGISADDLPLVFDRFWRAPTPTRCRAPDSACRSFVAWSMITTETSSSVRTPMAALACD